MGKILAFVGAIWMAQAHAATPGYYNQFLFTPNGTCTDRSTVSFQSTFSWEPAVLGDDGQGREVEATLALQIFKDGTYWADYEESARQGNVSFPLFSRDLEGTWQVNGDQIVFSGLGEGVPATYSDSTGGTYQSFKLTLTAAPHDPRALHSVMNVLISISLQGPKGITVAQYCH